VTTRSGKFLDVLGDFVVRVEGEGTRGGSGFFAGRGLVVTCAHVVAPTPGGGSVRAAARAGVSWRGRHAEGTVTALPAEHHGTGLWAYPDLAVIALDEPVPDHPWVPMTTQTPRIGRRLCAAGYSAVYGSVPRLGASTVEHEAPLATAGGEVLQLKNGELAAGKSGGPLIDLERGEVCGIVTTTRRENLDMGGLAVPVSALTARFPGVLAANRASSALTSRLWRLRAELEHEYGPGAVLSLREEQALLSAAESSGRSPAWLFWHSVHPDYGTPASPLADMADVLREVADAPAGVDGVHPLVTFVELVTAAAGRGARDPLAGLAAQVAERLGSSRPAGAAARGTRGARRRTPAGRGGGSAGAGRRDQCVPGLPRSGRRALPAERLEVPGRRRPAAPPAVRGRAAHARGGAAALPCRGAAGRR
jgi:hypothetical protein